MKNRLNILLITLVSVLAWGSSAYAGCTNAQFAGTWDVTFSDGNSCTFLVDKQGDVIADESICNDPFRGTTAPDSGSFAVAEGCSFEAGIVVEGIPIELAGYISRGRDTGAGSFVLRDFFLKGGITLVRLQ